MMRGVLEVEEVLLMQYLTILTVLYMGVVLLMEILRFVNLKWVNFGPTLPILISWEDIGGQLLMEFWINVKNEKCEKCEKCELWLVLILQESYPARWNIWFGNELVWSGRDWRFEEMMMMIWIWILIWWSREMRWGLC